MIGQKLGSFQVESILGSGAMGVVYLATYGDKGKKAAIKVIGTDQVGKGNSYDRFVREAVILEQFRHPNIVRYLARGRANGVNYYAMEFVEGQTVDHILVGRGPFPWRAVVSLGIQLCDALHYAHERGIVHRDLKPSNLMIMPDGRLKLTDFGIAKDLDATALTATGRTVGTAAYMAPEQIRGTYAISHKTDLYALGCVLYQLLTNTVPFPGQTAVVMMHSHINDPPPHPSKKTEEIPKELDNLVVALMAKEPADRPWDAAAVAETLRALQKKDQAKEKIPMVWPEPGSAAANPTRAEVLADPKPAKERKKGKNKAKKRVGLDVLLPLVGLIVVGSLIAYLVWPPGSEYLYRHAKELMASSEPLEWIRARERYLDPLDAQFPKHAHRDEVDAWRDRIDLHQAKRRAEILERPTLIALTKPKTEAEILFRTTYEEATAAEALHHDGDARDLWKKMEESLAPEGRKERGWVLLAQARAEEIERRIQQRREIVEGLLAKAAIPPQLAVSEAALKYRLDTLNDLIKRFEAYPDVADLVGQAREIVAAEQPPEPEQVPDPETRKPDIPAPKASAIRPDP